MLFKKYTLLLSTIVISILGCSQEAVTFDIRISQVSVINEKGVLQDGLYDVYIKGDTIARIDTYDKAVELSASQEIDGSGKYIMPGLWDNHTHFRGGEQLIQQNEKFLQFFINNGITIVRDAGGDLTTQVQRWNEAIQNKKKIGPTIYTSGPKLDGPKARWAGSLEITSAGDINGALDSLQQLGVDYIKLYDSTISGKNYLEIIRQAEARNMITSGHMPFTVNLEDAIEAGLDNVEHLYYILKGCSSKEKEITEQIRNGDLGFWDSMAQLIETYDEETARQLFNKLKDNNVYVTPTLHIGNILSYLDEVDHTQDTYLKNLSPAFLATYDGRNKSALNASPEAKANRKSLQQFFLTLTKSLSDHGVRLLAGSDSGAYNSYTYPGPSLHGELQEMVRAGLTPQQALNNSYNGARFLKRDGYRMQTGNKADIVLLNSNPLEDIKNTLTIQAVIKSGVYLQLED